MHRLPRRQLRVLRHEGPQNRARVGQQLPAIFAGQSADRALQIPQRARAVAGGHFAQRQPRRLHGILLGIPGLALSIRRQRRLEPALQEQCMPQIVMAKGQVR